MNKEEFLRDFAETIDRKSPVRMEDEFKNYDEWCSIAYISVLALLYDKYDTEIDDETMRRMRTVGDLYNLCNK